MKPLYYLNCGFLCGICTWLMSPLWLGVFQCENKDCKQFHKKMKIKPMEAEWLEIEG